MNIQQAKQEIIRTLRAYTARDADGAYVIPPDKQRPILLIGPPGIGKTAIMRQIAAEAGAGLVAYTMTHHTRQSAIGLPFISRRDYDGREYSITEYTMSEIVASIYDYMNDTGKKSGILFLDEINCVSETLAPVMLQLLQNKTFGNHPLPEDWIIVAAGNPPEYNKSVRELDMATLDRVKNMEIAADLAVWQDYARRQEIHPAIRTYLSIYPEHFYNITNTDRGQLFVTARGWEDLSCILLSYEAAGESVDEEFFLQYLQHDDIAHSFAMYYSLYRSFPAAEGADADVFADTLLSQPEKLEKCGSAECLAIAAIFFHGIQAKAARRSAALLRLKRLEELTRQLPAEGDLAEAAVREAFFAKRRQSMEILISLGQMQPGDEFREKSVLDELERDMLGWLTGERALPFPAYETARIAALREEQELATQSVLEDIDRAYAVLEKCPQGRSALLYLTGDLGGEAATEELLRDHSSPVWLRWCRELLSAE